MTNFLYSQKTPFWQFEQHQILTPTCKNLTKIIDPMKSTKSSVHVFKYRIEFTNWLHITH